MFCPECESRCIELKKTDSTIRYKCARTACGKEFLKKN